MKFTAIVFLYFISYACSAQISTYKEDIQSFRSKNWKSLIADPRTKLRLHDSIFLDYYPIKESNKVFCSVELLQDQEPFDMPTYSGQLKVFKRYAVLKFNWKGHPVKIVAYQNLQLTAPIYKTHLFIPIKDKSSGRQTYDGGRYLDIESTAIQNGQLILDLNHLYNPWCAYSDGYNCPIPPRENHLNVMIKAGEKKFKKEH